MLQAFVLIQTEAGASTKARSEIASVPGVRLAQSVTGPYDLIVRAEGADMDELLNRSMSSSSGLVDLAAEAIACEDIPPTFPPALKLLKPPSPSSSRLVLDDADIGSSSKSNRFSACCPATTVCNAFSRDTSSSGLVNISKSVE